MRKLRLVLFEKCGRNCPGCCNKDWDIAGLPVCRDFRGYDLIMLTGGEPMLDPILVDKTIAMIRQQNPDAKVYMYTARTRHAAAVLGVLRKLDGMCVTLHDQTDVEPFRILNDILLAHASYKGSRSLRLNIFKGVDVGDTDLSKWKVKADIEWIKDAPLPEGETIMRLTRKG